MASAANYNLRNPAVKRILQEVKELEKESSSEFIAQALEDNLFEWHFVMRGPSGTAFEGGIYHGRILLPAEYPMKPPSFMMLTPNGRFQTNTKICLSISSHHPEHWQPSWSVRTALTAMAAFMPTPGNGAIGSMDLPEADRKQLAKESRSFVPTFGSSERQAISAEMHKRMLVIDEAAASAEAHQRRECKEEEGEEADVEASDQSEPKDGNLEEVEGRVQVRAADGPDAAAAAAEEKSDVEEPLEKAKADSEGSEHEAVQPTPPAAMNPVHQDPASPPRPPGPQQQQQQQQQHAGMQRVSSRSSAGFPQEVMAEDKGLAWLAGALSVAIAALLLRKIFVFFDISVEEILSL